MMKKKMNFIFVMLAAIILLVNPLNVSAANTEIVIGDDDFIYVDVQALMEELDVGIEGDAESKSTRASEMPTQTWDWSQGMYSGSFEIEWECSYTQYNFTGTSELNVSVCASRDRYTPASDIYYVKLMKGTGEGVALSIQEFNSTKWKGVKFYNMDPSEKYAVCFEKADDGSVLTGYFNIYLSE